MNFKVLATQDDIQTAVMRLSHGGESGARGNEHPESVQVLVVFQEAVTFNVYAPPAYDDG
jgi:hypothetical protein